MQTVTVRTSACARVVLEIQPGAAAGMIFIAILKSRCLCGILFCANGDNGCGWQTAPTYDSSHDMSTGADPSTCSTTQTLACCGTSNPRRQPRRVDKSVTSLFFHWLSLLFFNFEGNNRFLVIQDFCNSHIYGFLVVHGCRIQSTFWLLAEGL